MSDAAFVEKSQQWMAQIVKSEARGAGDWEGAMRRIARRIGVPYAKIWALKYRPPKTIDTSFFIKIGLAYEAMCNSQAQKFHAEARTTHELVGGHSFLFRAALAVGGAELGTIEAAQTGQNFEDRS